MGIIHGEAGYLPDFLDYFSTKFPSAPVKMEILGKKDIETTTMVNFYSQVSPQIYICHVNLKILLWLLLKFTMCLFTLIEAISRSNPLPG